MRATSACFVAVYAAATASAARILEGPARLAACLSCELVVIVALFSGWYLVVPAISTACFALMRRRMRARSTPGRLNTAPRRRARGCFSFWLGPVVFAAFQHYAWQEEAVVSLIGQ